MKTLKNNLKFLFLFVLFFTVFDVYGRVTAEQIQPGSDKDPIVTKSYVESQIGPLKDTLNRLVSIGTPQNNTNNSNNSAITDKVNDLAVKTKFLIDTNNQLVQKIKDLTAKVDAAKIDASKVDTTKSEGFKLVIIPPNKQVYLGEGAQLIMRSGKIMAYSNDKSGFSDVTTGTDTINGQLLLKNHLLICPKVDVRHLKTLAQSYVLINGKAQIK